MAGTGDPDTLVSGNPAPSLAVQAALLARPATIERRMADAIRALAIDAVDAAGSGHARLPLGMADAATALWGRVLRFDATDPTWPDRDRFVLSAGHGAMLLYALLHLTGHAGMSAEDLQRFRQLDSPAAGHPEYGDHPAIEATTGPLGQGLAAAVGMALAERMLAARFGRSLVDHRTWVIASDGDLMQGVGQEAADLAGHLRLQKLTVLWDDNGLSQGTEPPPAPAADVLKRFAALGWATKRVDGHDPAQMAAALSLAIRSKKPTLIACRTVIGAPAPAQGGPEATEAKRALDWHHPPFTLPPLLAARWHEAGSRGTASRRAWLKRLANHPLRAEFERVLAGRPPDSWREAMSLLKAELAESRPSLSGRMATQRTLAALAPSLPELVGGSAGGPNLAQGGAVVSPANYAGRVLQFGAREHAMAGCLNGMALHGGLLAYGGAKLAFSDYLRPALRLAAIMRLRVIHVLTDDGIGLGADGPAHQPVEQLATLRALPGVHLMRPADAIEAAECWELAIRRTDGPSLLVLSSQDLPALRQDAAENRCARGGYVLAEADGPRRATLVATGSEVAVAMEARRQLAEGGIAAAVVSLPCWELFAVQDEGYRQDVLGAAPRFGIEAGCGFGWERWLGGSGLFTGMEGFGASAPGPELYRHFGITPEAITAAVRKRLPPVEGN